MGRQDLLGWMVDGGGQAASRHLVAASLVEEYTALLAERAEKLRVGDPAADDDVAYGPLIDEAARDRVHAIVTTVSPWVRN
jgi:benzaldehyde dehydrogenase (NAD)